MVEIDLRELLQRTTSLFRQTLENASGLAMHLQHFQIEPEHCLIKALELSDTEFSVIVDELNLDRNQLTRRLTDAIQRMRSGNGRGPGFAPAMVDAFTNGWLIASAELGANRISSGHFFAGLMRDKRLRGQLVQNVPELEPVGSDRVMLALKRIAGKTMESREASLGAAVSAGKGEAPNTDQPGAGNSALARFTVNLVERAQQGQIDAVLGRDAEIRQCIDILSRRRQNNPILTGEAGVGKTAVVEGLALRIANNDVPESLQGVALHSLDLGLLQAGASMKGEFEQRLKSVVEEVKASSTPIILFIDEAHTLIGAGGKEGQGDAANLLKPALARGELRTIAATTWAEYKKYFERDPALTRRFQVVKVEEPEEQVAIEMMRGIADGLAAHHGVRIQDDAIVQAVRLSARYIPGRQLPDKAVSLLDTASARVALSQSSTPAQLEDVRRRAEQVVTAIRLLGQENLASGEHDERLEELREEEARLTEEAEQLEVRWQQEKALVEQILELRETLEADGPEHADLASRRESLRELENQLAELQGEQPLVTPSVGGQAVAEIVANWTGIPVGKMLGDEIKGILDLRSRLEQRVIGQSHALEAIAQSIRTSRAGLTDPRKPIGVFLMVGTSGVGKTETALTLADALFGGEQNLTVINMSEFKEEHKVSMLLGSPPGYVGYGEGGVLTEAARRKPYSVILLDEMEKAHPGVQDVFYNLFDKGTIKDGEGRDIDFRNTVIIMTSNAGEDAIRAIVSQSETRPEPDVLLDSMRHELLKHFKPAFLGRANVVAYYPLDDENLMQIANLAMKRIERRVSSHYGAGFTWGDDVVLHVVARSQEVDTGARNIEHILNRTLLPDLSAQCLARMADGESVDHIHIDVDEDGNFLYQFNAAPALAQEGA